MLFGSALAAKDALPADIAPVTEITIDADAPIEAQIEGKPAKFAVEVAPWAGELAFR